MATEPKAPAVEEVHILWISEGMSCDGDSVSITAAGQPGIEDVLLGAIPGIPKVHLHNKVLSPTLGGEEFMKPFRDAADGKLDAPYVLVVEGSIPNEKINGEGYWTSMGNDLTTGEPIGIPAVKPIPVYACKIEDGAIWVDMEQQLNDAEIPHKPYH